MKKGSTVNRNATVQGDDPSRSIQNVVTEFGFDPDTIPSYGL
jgi:hypothetical protein